VTDAGRLAPPAPPDEAHPPPPVDGPPDRMEWQSRLVDYFCVCGVEPSNRDLSVDADATTPPRLLQHYPAQPRPDFAAAEFGDALPTFCFPDGDLRAQPAPSRPSIFSLICSEPDGQRYYAFVLSYSVRAERCPAGWAQAFLPTCWVVVSHWPFFDQFRLALLELYRLAWRASSDVWSSHVVQLCDEIPLPPRGQLKVTSVFYEQLLVFSRPPVNRLPMLDGAHLARLFTCLSPENVLQLVASLATEQRCVLLSEKRETLTMVAQAALLLLFPFCEWPHALITVLPTSLADYLQAPVPYLIGLEVEEGDDFVSTGLWKGADCTCFDLRTNTVSFHPRQPPPEIPEHQASKLLQACQTSVLATEGRAARERGLHRERSDTVQLEHQDPAAEDRSHAWAPEQEAELGLSWIATEIGERMMGSDSERLADGSDGADIMTIRYVRQGFSRRHASCPTAKHCLTIVGWVRCCTGTPISASLCLCSRITSASRPARRTQGMLQQSLVPSIVSTGCPLIWMPSLRTVIPRRRAFAKRLCPLNLFRSSSMQTTKMTLTGYYLTNPSRW
jgi:hypothetical protein